MSNSRVIVFGYGELAVTAVEALGGVGADVAALVLPSNRSGPDVDKARVFATQQRLLTFTQPPRKQIDPFVAQLRALAPDLILIWSYSMILPPCVLAVPRLGCVNLHGGLLPEYRGGHVMQWAIINGEAETGVTLHYVDEGIDTGPVIAAKRFSIESEDDALSVRMKLKTSGASLIKEWWPAIAAGTAPRVKQDESRARYHRLRTEADGLIDWAASNAEVHNLTRALVEPWPGSFTYLQGRKIVLRKVQPVESRASEKYPPGVVCEIENGHVRVSTGAGDILIREAWVEQPGAEAQNLRDAGVAVGDILGNH